MAIIYPSDYNRGIFPRISIEKLEGECHFILDTVDVNNRLVYIILDQRNGVYQSVKHIETSYPVKSVDDITIDFYECHAMHDVEDIIFTTHIDNITGISPATKFERNIEGFITFTPTGKRGCKSKSDCRRPRIRVAKVRQDDTEINPIVAMLMMCIPYAEVTHFDYTYPTSSRGYNGVVLDILESVTDNQVAIGKMYEILYASRRISFDEMASDDSKW